MAIIIFGVRQKPIDIDEVVVKCPSCEKLSSADIMVIGKYFHFFWLPFCPTEKELNIICKECGLKRYGLNFDSTFISNFEEIKSKFNHPWSSYLGLTLLIVLILSIILIPILTI